MKQSGKDASPPRELNERTRDLDKVSCCWSRPGGQTWRWAGSVGRERRRSRNRLPRWGPRGELGSGRVIRMTCTRAEVRAGSQWCQAPWWLWTSGGSCVEAMVLEIGPGLGWLVHRDLRRLGCRSELWPRRTSLSKSQGIWEARRKSHGRKGRGKLFSREQKTWKKNSVLMLLFYEEKWHIAWRWNEHSLLLWTYSSRKDPRRSLVFKSHPPHPVPVSAIAAVDSGHHVNSWKADCSDRPLSSVSTGGPRVRAAEDGGPLGTAHPESESPADWLFTHTHRGQLF